MLDRKAIIDWLKNNEPHKLIQRWRYYHSYFKKPCEIVNEKKPKEFEIYTVAFNNNKVIDYQIKFMKKHFKDEHQHIIVDNSSNKEISREIREICINNDTMYIRLPKNTLFSSQNHALALNYLRKNIISQRIEIKYFWFLDHDIFPIKDTYILPFLKKQKMYWYLLDKEKLEYARNAWTIRPWFCFFDKSISKKFDFRPAKSILPLYALDTWWKNYRLIFKNFDKNKLEFASKDLIWVREDQKGMKLEYSKYANYTDGDKYLKNNNILYTYELIKDNERIHRWWTYYVKNNKNSYEEYLNTVELFFKRLDKFL